MISNAGGSVVVSFSFYLYEIDTFVFCFLFSLVSPFADES